MGLYGNFTKGRIAKLWKKEKFCIDPLHPNISMYILHTVLYTFPPYVGKENLINNLEVLQSIVISFILMTLMFDSGVILWGEIRC